METTLTAGSYTQCEAQKNFPDQPYLKVPFLKKTDQVQIRQKRISNEIEAFKRHCQMQRWSDICAWWPSVVLKWTDETGHL